MEERTLSGCGPSKGTVGKHAPKKILLLCSVMTLHYNFTSWPFVPKMDIEQLSKYSLSVYDVKEEKWLVEKDVTFLLCRQISYMKFHWRHCHCENEEVNMSTALCSQLSDTSCDFSRSSWVNPLCSSESLWNSSIPISVALTSANSCLHFDPNYNLRTNDRQVFALQHNIEHIFSYFDWLV